MSWRIQADEADYPLLLEVRRRVASGDASPADEVTALTEVARSGAPAFLAGLQGHIDLHQDLGRGVTLLHLVAEAGYDELAALLLALGANGSATTDRGLTASDTATRGGHDDLAASIADLAAYGQAASAVLRGDLAELERLLTERPQVIADAALGRTLLHVAVTWPAHIPRAPESIRRLCAAGAEVDAPCVSDYSDARETALHWAVSADDVAAAEALIACGASVDAPGAVIAAGTPLVDAVVFRKWAAARCLVEHGAAINLPYAAALGLMDIVVASFDTQGRPRPGSGDLPCWPPQVDLDGVLHLSLYMAVHGRQGETARFLLDRGADPAWIGPVGKCAQDEVVGDPAWVSLLNTERP